jgi:hypothetical protein
MRLLVTALLLGVVGCSSGASGTFQDDSLSFRYPSSWYVTGFSTTNSPRRLSVTSYVVPEDAVEGDCGGLAAVQRLTADGAFVILIDYGDPGSDEFPPPPRPFRLADGQFAEYECFGASTMFRFTSRDHDLQAHVGPGTRAGDARRRDALAILDSLVSRR